MLQKAIENWLINTNERRYQLPFVQVLIAEGHTIKYVSKHNQFEQGKDVISIDPSGEVWAFQLKTGNVDLNEWRNISGEIRELAELSPVHSSIPVGTAFHAVLVTNGRITDTVRHQIVQINIDNEAKNRQVAHIETIELDELIGRFLKAQGDFIPVQPVDVNKFLTFYLATGEEFFDKGLFQEFIIGSCLLENPGTGTGAKHAVTSAVIMTAYLLKNFQEKGNHFAVFEAWVSLLGHIYRFSVQKKLSKNLIDGIAELILDEIINELQQLEEEVLTRPEDQPFFEGDMYGDGSLIYRARATIVLGSICAFHEYLREHNLTDDSRKKFSGFLTKNLKHLWLWGESSFPFFYWIFRFLESDGEAALADKLLLGVMDNIVGAHNQMELWFPTPYVTAEEVIKKFYEMILPSEEREVEPKGIGSYVLKTLIEMIVRRGGRKILEPRWRAISIVYFLEFVPANKEDFFLWRVEKGTNDSKPPEKTESWKKLIEYSTDKLNIPIFEYKWSSDLLPFYSLVSPHRVTASVIKKFELK